MSTPHSGDSYEEIAANYAKIVDNKAQNAHYERPATLSLLPDLAALDVLDVGCGSGWYAEYFLSQGASVTSFDYNAEFVAITQARVGDKAQVLQADLAQPLTFAADRSFDLIVAPLVMHYLKEWLPTFREFYRVLRPDGLLVFSTHHPFHDWQSFGTDSYFDTELLHDEWKDVGKVSFYRRPLTTMSADLQTAGFLIERLLEPLPSPTYKELRPDWYEKMTTQPWFLFIRARKNG